MGSTQSINDLKYEAWWVAIRPATLPLSMMPILSGSALAYSTSERFEWDITFFCLIVALFIQIGTNLINDAIDFKKGADTSVRKGPLRATQAGLLTYNEVLKGAFISFFVAILFGLPLLFDGGWPIAILLFLSVAMGYSYTAGPFPLAYLGLGELFVWMFFGLASVIAVFYLHNGRVDYSTFLLGNQLGLLAAIPLAINNYRDRNEDKRVNKNTLAVRFGVQFAKWEIITLALLPFVLSLFWLPSDYFLSGWLSLLALPIAIQIVRQLLLIDPQYNQLLGFSVLLTILFSVCVSLGFIL